MWWTKTGQLLGEAPPSMFVNHKDGIKTNNAIWNLEYATDAENKKHAAQHKLMAHGSLHFKAKLSEVKVRCIKFLAESGMPKREISRLYGVSNAAILAIIKGKTWTHVTQ